MRATRHRPLTALLLALGLLVAAAAGCSSSGVDDAASSGEATERLGVADEASAADTAGGDSAGTAGGASAAPDLGVDPAVAAASAQQLILTGSISVVVDDLDQAVARAGRIATANGGLVFGEQTSRSENPGSVLTLKVRPDAFMTALDDLGALGEEQDRNIGSEDVTSQVVDLDSRIATAEASVDRLRALILRAEDIDDIAVLENELLNRETTLETLRGERRTIGDQVALATITVTLTPAADSPDTPPADDDLPGFLDAFGGGWDALVKVGTVAGLVVAALVPWVPVVLVIALVAHLLVRRSRRRRVEAGLAGPSGPAGPTGGFPPPPPPAPPADPTGGDPQEDRVPVGAGAGGTSSPEGQSLS